MVKPPKEISESFGSAPLEDDRMIDRAFFIQAKVATTIKQHLVKKGGMWGQSSCVDLESLSFNLRKS